jgi:hypothetical protein
VFPFARFPGVDPVLSPEMKSTGEVMGIDSDFARAFLKSQQGAGVHLPQDGTVFVSVKDSDKPVITAAVRAMLRLGFRVVATGGTRLSAAGGAGGRPGQQGRAGPPAHRRQDQGRRDRPGLQHHRRLAEPQGQRVDPCVGGSAEGAVLHHCGFQRGGGAGHSGAAGAPA